MACPTAGSMDKCDPKCRCSSGPCAGAAFPCDDPCQGRGEFDPASCDCIDDWTEIRYRIMGKQTTYKYCCDNVADEGCSGCTGTMVPGYPIVSTTVFTEEDIVILRNEWDARYSLGINTDDPCNTYEQFATLASTKKWRGPGLRWLSSSPDNFNGTCNPFLTATTWSCIGRCDSNLFSNVITGYEVIDYTYPDEGN